MPIESPSTDAPARDQRNALLAGFLGWTLDAFDFFLVIFCVSAIAKDFHRSNSEIIFGAVTMTLAGRPLGAFIFGLMADRYGRRLPLILDLVFYSVIEVLTGLAPGYWSFVVLRALFGIGMGGEWGVGASLAMEKVSPRWRGVLSGVLQEGYALGNILAALAYLFVFPRFGWRPLFFIGGLPALLSLFIRFGVRESAVWEKTRQGTWSGLGRAIVSHWKVFLGIAVLMTCMNCASHGTQDLYPTFLEKGWGFSPQKRAILTAVTSVGAILGGIIFGLYSDRFGRRRAMIIAFIGAIVMVPLWAFSPSMGLMVLGGFLIQFMVQGAWGIIPAHIAELSPDSVRGFLPGFAYQCGAPVSGLLPWFQSVLARQWGFAKAMSFTASLVFVVAIVVIALGREKHRVVFGQSTE